MARREIKGVKHYANAEKKKRHYSFNLLMEDLHELAAYAIFCEDFRKQTMNHCNKLISNANPNQYRDDADLEFLYKTIAYASKLRLQNLDDKIFQEELNTGLNRLVTIEEDTQSYVDNFMNSSFAVYESMDVAITEQHLNRKWQDVAMLDLIPQIEEMAQAARNQGFDFKENYSEKLLDLCQGYIKDMRMNSSELNLEGNLQDLDFTNEGILSRIENARKRRNEKGYMVPSAIQWHNNQISGGYQAGRTYLYTGMSGGGKSNFLLSLTRWFCQYSEEIVPYNVELKPIVLYVSLENDLDDILERLIDILYPPFDREQKESLNISPNEIKDTLADLPIRCKYRHHKSINTADLEDMIDELEEEGLEVRMLILDYTKRINPVEKTGDIRLDLAEIVNELAVIAKYRAIPVITAAQMNIEGIEVLQNADEDNLHDALKKLGSRAVGESRAMIENTDYSFLIHNQVKSTTKSDTKYITFKRIKGRGKDLGGYKPYFAHPYYEKNGLVLAEDIYQDKSESLAELTDPSGDEEIGSSNSGGQKYKGRGRPKGNPPIDRFNSSEERAVEVKGAETAEEIEAAAS